MTRLVMAVILAGVCGYVTGQTYPQVTERELAVVKVSGVPAYILREIAEDELNKHERPAKPEVNELRDCKRLLLEILRELKMKQVDFHGKIHDRRGESVIHPTTDDGGMARGGEG